MPGLVPGIHAPRARIEHLTIADRVRIDCQCGRTALIAVRGLSPFPTEAHPGLDAASAVR